MSIMSSDPEIDEIRRRMSLIRRDMHVNIKTAVQSAERLFDWKEYVTSYPWIALALAAGAGFMLAPARRRAADVPPAPSTVILPAAAETNPQTDRPAPTKPQSRGEWFGFALGILGPVAIRVAQNYSINAIESWIESQLAATRGMGPRRTQEQSHDEPRSGLASGTRGARSL